MGPTNPSFHLGMLKGKTGILQRGVQVVEITAEKPEWFLQTKPL